MADYLDDNGNPTSGPQGSPTQAPPNLSSGGNPQARNPSGGSTVSAEDSRATITALYKQYYGRAPTARELAEWGDNVDANYAKKIAQQLQNSTEGVTYQKTSTEKRINGLYQELVGRNATREELDKYGTNINDDAFNRIRTTLAGSQEARDWEANPNKGGGTPAPTTPGGGGGGGKSDTDIRAELASGNHDTVIQGLRDLAAARGSKPAESSYETWANYILNGNGESKDSGYFIDRVMNSDPEFGGKPSSNYLDPWGGKYTPPDYHPPPPFVAPDPSKVLDDPAIKLQLQESLKALQNSALSRGTLLTGGTAVDVNNMAQQVAAAGYDKLYNRAVAEDQTKYGRSLDEYGIARDNTLAQYQDQKGTFYDNQDRPFQKLMSIAGLGQNALGQANQINAGYVGGYNQALMGGTGAANGYYTSGAAAYGAGQVGASNAWSQALGNTSNYLGYLYNRYNSGGGRGYSQPSGYGQPYYGGP